MAKLVRIGAVLLLCFSGSVASSQSKPAEPRTPQDLSALEEHLAGEFNSVRKSWGLKPLPFRKDTRVRMEACSVAVNGPDSIVESRDGYRKYWYVTRDPQAGNSVIKQVAEEKNGKSTVAVGVWYAAKQEGEPGEYWVVIYPEDTAAQEGFRRHFYLTDSFEYATRFDKYWKKKLPEQCRNIK